VILRRRPAARVTPPAASAGISRVVAAGVNPVGSVATPGVVAGADALLRATVNDNVARARSSLVSVTPRPPVSSAARACRDRTARRSLGGPCMTLSDAVV